MMMNGPPKDAVVVLSQLLLDAFDDEARPKWPAHAAASLARTRKVLPCRGGSKLFCQLLGTLLRNFRLLASQAFPVNTVMAGCLTWPTVSTYYTVVPHASDLIILPFGRCGLGYVPVCSASSSLAQIGVCLPWTDRSPGCIQLYLIRRVLVA